MSRIAACLVLCAACRGSYPPDPGVFFEVVIDQPGEPAAATVATVAYGMYIDGQTARDLAGLDLRVDFDGEVLPLAESTEHPGEYSAALRVGLPSSITVATDVASLVLSHSGPLTTVVVPHPNGYTLEIPPPNTEELVRVGWVTGPESGSGIILEPGTSQVSIPPGVLEIYVAREITTLGPDGDDVDLAARVRIERYITPP